MKSRENFLNMIKRSGVEELLPREVCAGAAAQAAKPAGAGRNDVG